MSRTVIYTVNIDGTILPWQELRDTEPITSFVWTNIINQYRELTQIPANETVFIDPRAVMRIIRNGQLRLELCELAVLALTFDRAIVKREHLLTLSALIEQFINKHPQSSKTNLILQAATLRTLAEQEHIIGVCWQYGDINPWLNLYAQDSNSESYNIYQDQQHWFIFVDGFLPPMPSKRTQRLLKISISYDIDEDITSEKLQLLAEQYRLFTTNIIDNLATPIKVDVCKSNRI